MDRKPLDACVAVVNNTFAAYSGVRYPDTHPDDELTRAAFSLTLPSFCILSSSLG